MNSLDFPIPSYIKIELLNDQAKIPVLGSDTAAGFDLYAIRNQTVSPGSPVTIPLGFSTELPDSIHGRIESRSGMALRGLVVLTGVIDSDYRGEWKVIVQATTNQSHEIKAGDRIAQVVFRPTIRPRFTTVEMLTDTARGTGGFGSTGTN